MTHATLTVMLAAGGAWLAENAWRQWGREATESRLLAGQKAAHADYRVTIEYRQETADLARVFSATLKADGFNTEIAETPLALPAEAGASLPADNRIQWGGSPDDPIVEHIGERLRYFAWGRAPKVTNQSDPPAESANRRIPRRCVCCCGPPALPAAVSRTRWRTP